METPYSLPGCRVERVTRGSSTNVVLVVRWEKREDTYLAMLHFALGLIT
jgi:hypothetical protein